MIAGTGLLSCIAATALAHPFHMARFEAGYNRDEGVLEVAMRVYLDDFEAALRAHAGRAVLIEEGCEPGCSEAASAYLAEGWIWREPGEQEPEEGWPEAEVAWVGFEMETLHAWIFYTVTVPGELGVLELSVPLMFEFQDGQENVLTLIEDDEKRSFVFTEQEAWHAVGAASD